MVVNSSEKYSLIRACSIIFSDIPEYLFQEAGNSILTNLSKWRTILIDNLSAVLQVDYREGHKNIVVNEPYGYGKFGIVGELNGKKIGFTLLQDMYGPTVYYFNKILYLGLTDLQEVLNASSEEKSPLLPFYLFLDSERAYSNANFRKAILDAASAMESALSLIIDNHLPYNNDLNKYISSKHNSLKLKRELLKKLLITLPFKENDYSKHLDSVRNKVIHAGYFPTREEVAPSITIVKNTLYQLFPKIHEL